MHKNFYGYEKGNVETRMVYRKIATHNGNDILRPLSEEETAVYYRNKQNRKKKEDRQNTVAAYIGGFLMAMIIFSMPVISILMAGIQ